MTTDLAEQARAIAIIRDYLSILRKDRPAVKLTHDRSSKGASTIKQILGAAHRVFVKEGYAGLTIRKVANEAGLAVGNVSYYFSTKHDLIVATLHETMTDYVEEQILYLQTDQDSPLEILSDIVAFYVRNISTTYPLFHQLWGYAGTSEEAKKVVRDLYRPLGQFVYHLVKACNPLLNHEDARKAVFQIFCLEQGMKLILGMGLDDNISIQAAEDSIRDATKKIVMTT